MSGHAPPVQPGEGLASVVTICGSTRFRDEIAEVNRELTLAGYIVLAPGVFGHDGDEITAADKASSIGCTSPRSTWPVGSTW